MRRLWKHRQSEEPVKVPWTFLSASLLSYLELTGVGSGIPVLTSALTLQFTCAIYHHVSIVLFSVEKLHFRTELCTRCMSFGDVSGSTDEAQSFSALISWFTSFIVALSPPPMPCLLSFVCHMFCTLCTYLYRCNAYFYTCVTSMGSLFCKYSKRCI